MKKYILIFSIIINISLIVLLFIQQDYLSYDIIVEAEKNLDEVNSLCSTIGFIAMKESSIKEKINLYCIYSFKGKEKKIEVRNNVISLCPWKTMKTFDEKIFGTKDNIEMYIDACNGYAFSSAAYSLMQGNKDEKDVSIKIIELLSQNANSTSIYYAESPNRLKPNHRLEPNQITPRIFLTEYNKFVKKEKYHPMMLRGPCVRYISTEKSLGLISKQEFSTRINKLGEPGQPILNTGCNTPPPSERSFSEKSE